MAVLPVSVCIIAKNEEKYIEQCLKSVSQYGFEIVVADTGSSDRTKELAEKYTDRLFDFEWCADFSKARNFCAGKASNDWILAIDCDEQIQELDMNRFGELIGQFPHSVGRLAVKNVKRSADGGMDYETDEIVRLYNKKEYAFASPIHEQIRRIGAPDGEALQGFDIPMELIHYGYALSGEKMAEKQHRNLELLYRQAESEPDNAYIYFQIGQSQAIIGNHTEAITAYEKSLAMDGETAKPYVQLMLVSLMKTYRTAGRMEDALALAQEYASRCATSRFVEAHAELLWNCGQRLKAMVLYLKATLMPDADTLGEGLLRCYAHLIQGYYDTGDIRMAELFKQKFAECKEQQENQLFRT